MKYLIVTADDLGLSKSINEGVARALTDGIVTAVSVIPSGEAFEDGIRVIKGLGLKEIGAHLALTETKPLLTSSESHKNHNELFFKLLSHAINTKDIYKELKAQLELLKNTGIKITQINSHEHIHIIPEILDIFIDLAREYDIPAIRFPRGDRPPRALSVNENYRSLLLKYFARKMEKRLSGSGLVRTDFFMGLLDAGKLDIDKIKNIIGNLKDGVTELVTHPGFLSPEVLSRYPWHIGCEAELFALTDKRVKNAITNYGIKLIYYEDFLAIK